MRHPSSPPHNTGHVTADGIVRCDVVVVGAGASGLFCARECGKRKRSVVVLDHAERMCSKVLISGGGRCNFTNLAAGPENYISENPHFCRSALARFTHQEILSLVRKHHIPYYEKEAGQLFCSTSSRDIVRMLKTECDVANVSIRLRHHIRSIEKRKEFLITTDQGTFVSDSLVIATGGLSYAKMGASGFGYDLARQFGHRVTALRPGLVPLTLSGQDRLFCRNLAGISVTVAVACSGMTFQGGLLFTHQGISGPAVLQVSSYWKPGATVSVDFFPQEDIGAILDQEKRSRVELKNFLGKYLPKRLSEAWCETHVSSKPLIQYNDKERRNIAMLLHAWTFTPSGTEGYPNAEVTAGGLDTRSVSSKTMESNIVPGLYFIGEVLDVTGHLGGYNLHWAWASGHAAGQNA